MLVLEIVGMIGNFLYFKGWNSLCHVESYFIAFVEYWLLRVGGGFMGTCTFKTGHFTAGPLSWHNLKIN